MDRVVRYEPLDFLLSYVVVDPLPGLIQELQLEEEEKESFLQQLSPLDYFFHFQNEARVYLTDILEMIGNGSTFPRLKFMNELDFSKIIGQRLAKSIIREQIVTHFWDCCN
jgi:hypothetical protein